VGRSIVAWVRRELHYFIPDSPTSITDLWEAFVLNARMNNRERVRLAQRDLERAVLEFMLAQRRAFAEWRSERLLVGALVVIVVWGVMVDADSVPLLQRGTSYLASWPEIRGVCGVRMKGGPALRCETRFAQ
jgi:hypothetical protein